MSKKPDDDAAPRWRPAPLLPREPAQDLLLVFVTGVLCFFACLAVICALAAGRAAGGWTDQLKDSATVLIRPVGDESADTAAGRAAAALGGATAALVAAMARLMGGSDGLTPVLPVAWTDLLCCLACPLVAAVVAAVAARMTAGRLIGGLP